MQRQDLPDIALREQRIFPSGVWEEDRLLHEFHNRRRSRWYVYVMNGSIRGHLGCWIMPDHLHITTVAVDQAHRRQGIATSLIKHLHDDLDYDRPYQLEVRQSNDAARKLYETLGYKLYGRRPNYYSNNGEDALIMRRPVKTRA